MQKSATIRIQPTTFEKRALVVLVALSLISLVAYAYFVNKTVWNVVTRQNAAKEIVKISSEMATLESSYMSESSELTIDRAYELGFKDVKATDTIFVVRSAPSVALR